MSPPEVKEVLPSRGALFHEEIPQYILCKPKILPLKSMTLEKVENMQRDAEERAKEQIRSERSQNNTGDPGTSANGSMT